MDSNQARELFHLLARIGSHLQDSVAFVKDHDSEEEFLRYRNLAGRLLGDLYLDGMAPLFHRFPEFRPDYIGGPYKIPEEVYLPRFYENGESEQQEGITLQDSGDPLTPSPKAP